MKRKKQAIVIATEDAIKIETLEVALGLLKLKGAFKIVPCATPHSVPRQPKGKKQMYQGTRSRLQKAHAMHPGAAAYLAIEDGIWGDPYAGKKFSSAYVVLLGADGKEFVSQSVAFTPSVLSLVEKGMSLGQAARETYGNTPKLIRESISSIDSGGVAPRLDCYLQPIAFVLTAFITSSQP